MPPLCGEVERVQGDEEATGLLLVKRTSKKKVRKARGEIYVVTTDDKNHISLLYICYSPKLLLVFWDDAY